MAVIVESTPIGGSGVNVLTSKVGFRFNMTGIVSGSIIKSFVYHLKLNDVIVTGLRAPSAIEAVPFELDFTEDIKSVSNTPFPNLSVTTDSVPEMITELKLMYAESPFNKDTCEQGSYAFTELGPFQVLNSTNQFLKLTPDNGPLFLTPKPEKLAMCRSGFDLAYFYSSGGGSIGINAYNSAGVLIGDTSETVSGVYMLKIATSSVPYLQGYGPEDVAYLALKVNGVEYTKYSLDCCYSTQMMFQSFGGGYQIDSFDKTEARSMKSKSTEISRAYQGPVNADNPYLNARKQRHGRTIVSKVSSRTITLTKTIDEDTEKTFQYIEDMISSKVHFINYGTPESPNFVKCILTNNNVEYFRDEAFTTIALTFEPTQDQYTPSSLI